MRIKEGRLVDYNYFDIKEIVREAMTRWRKEKLKLAIAELKRFITQF
ncbi:hypothetical protein ES705_09386 [subsurface metagenome]